MSDTSASRHARLGPMFASLLALLLAAYPVGSAADTVTWGVRAEATALAGNEPPQGQVSQTVAGQSGSADANVSQSGHVPPDENNSASGFAAASLRGGTLRVLATAAGPAAAGTALAAWNNTVFIQATQASDWSVVFRITGHISGDPLVNIADFDVRPGNAIVRSGDAVADFRGSDVSLFGNAVLSVPYHVDSAGLFNFPIGVELTAFAGDNGHVNFSETATAFLELPDGVTYLGDDSGQLFADRTDFIIHPGETLPGEPVPEPSALGLSVIGVFALALARLKGTAAA